MALIEQRTRESPWWTAERPRGEWLKLPSKVAKRTSQTDRPRLRSKPPTGQAWSTFVKTHGQDLGACASVPVVTLFVKTIDA